MATVLAAGQSFVLKVGAGGQFEGNNGPAITGASSWVATPRPTGSPIAGLSVMAADGIDGRATSDVASVLGSGYNRPEDLELQTSRTATNCSTGRPISRRQRQLPTAAAAYNMNLSTGEVPVRRLQLHGSAAGTAAGGGLRNADNLAIDAAGNIYIVRTATAADDDIWLAVDQPRRRPSTKVQASPLGFQRCRRLENTGLCFDKFNPNVAWQCQHPPAASIARS